jgi:hypothetical protein
MSFPFCARHLRGGRKKVKKVQEKNQQGIPRSTGSWGGRLHPVAVAAGKTQLWVNVDVWRQRQRQAVGGAAQARAQDHIDALHVNLTTPMTFSQQRLTASFIGNFYF